MSLTTWLPLLKLGRARPETRRRIGRRPRRRRKTCLLWVERLEDRSVPCGGAALPLPIEANGTVVDHIGRVGEVDRYQVTLAEPGRLSIVTTGSLDTRTSLRLNDGQLLIQSDGESAGNRNDRIVQHLLPGTYYLDVSNLGIRTGAYTLTTEFQPATPPHQPLRVDYVADSPYALSPPYHVTGDFNRDGHVDIATSNTYNNTVSVLLGLGDGTFQTSRSFAVGAGPFDIVAADFNGDHRLDLATANTFSNDVSILVGQGDGTFARGPDLPAGLITAGLLALDVNRDGYTDLIATNVRSEDVSVLLGLGNGGFAPQQRYAIGVFPGKSAAGDFNGDGHVDLVISNFNSNDVSLLFGRGDGTFRQEVRFDLQAAPNQVITADFNHDGRLDLAVANVADDEVGIHLGQGDGTFRTLRTGGPWGTGSTPFALAAADYNGDGHLDLAVANRQSSDVSILLGRGDGTFQEQVRFAAGSQPWFILAGDFNGDGRLDLSTANALSHDVSILIGLGDGTFQRDPTATRQAWTNPQGTVLRDFNGDGHLDLATITYTGGHLFVFLGRGDGTFHNRMRFPVGSTPVDLVAQDFDRDGVLDLATVNCDSVDLSILRGQGDGTFAPEQRFPASFSGEFILSADFNGDGVPDLATGGQYATGFAVLLGTAAGTFPETQRYIVRDSPSDAAAADFNNDGVVDLAFTNFFSSDHAISLYLGIADQHGRGTGTFEEPTPQRRFEVGAGPLGIVTADFNDDGHADLANANFGDNTVTVLLGQGNGMFEKIGPFPTGLAPDSIVTAHVNSDGFLDLVITNDGSPDVSILLGLGKGMFAPGLRVVVSDGASPRRGLDVGDINGDGNLDLALPQVLSNDVSVVLGSGDATFGAPLRFAVGLGPVAVVTGDFSSDGRVDVAGVNPTTNEVDISLGAGDTTFQDPVRLATGTTPVAVLRADFNGDGRLDLATANFGSDDVSVFLGLGTGTFRSEPSLAVGRNPTALAAGDFNGDGRLDLATANAGSNDVSVLYRRRDGTFENQVRLPAGDLPQALVAGDFNGDGIADLVTANYRSNDVALFLGRRNGTFADPLRATVGTGPLALLTGDFNGDRRLDLAVANSRANDVSVLLGRGDGFFDAAGRFAAGTTPLSLAISDFNGDDISDLAVANSTSDDVSLLLGLGNGTFAEPRRRAAGDYPIAVVADDFNNDGRADLAIATQLATQATILQGLGDEAATFVAAGTISTPLRATPRIADWNGDNLSDVAVVDREGRILLRLARPGQPGVFEAPVVVNPEPHPAARDLAIVATQPHLLVAAVDAKGSSLSLYERAADGTFRRSDGPQPRSETLPVAIAAGDLNGDGSNDLAVVGAGSGQVLVYLQFSTAHSPNLPVPQFSSMPDAMPDHTLDVGVSPSAIVLADVDGDQRLDIVVTNQYSGDVSILRNEGDCFCEQRYRAGLGLYGLQEHDGGFRVRSQQAPAGLAVGAFDADDAGDLVVTHSGSNSFAVLPGSGASGLLNPTADLTFATGLGPTVVVTGRFNDDAHLDVAILNEDSADLSIFLGDGASGFTGKGRIDAGNLPTGLAVHDVNADGRLDLLVGNEFGDLLTLLGNGDGTFQPYQRASRHIALAVADLNDDGLDDFIFGNEALDRISVQYSQPGQSFAQDRQDGILAPGAVTSTDLNSDGKRDLVVANTGANNVLVYLGTGQGQFGPAQRFFAGTSPTGVAVSHLNDDDLLDLIVANEGSNDVTLLLGQVQSSGWTLTSGVRLQAGAAPVAATVHDVTGFRLEGPAGNQHAVLDGQPDGTPDILISNSQSNTISLLPGTGLGFFIDKQPALFPTGDSPRQALVGNFDSGPDLDLISLNAGSNSLTFFSSFASAGAVGLSIASGGLSPVAALSGDFNRDGLSDLVVAHNGDGVVSLLLGHDGGLSLQATRTAGLAHPTALAFADAAANELGVYVAGEGAEAVGRLAFALEFGPISLATSEPPGGGRAQIAALLPLQESTVAIVATLLSVRPESDLLLASDADLQIDRGLLERAAEQFGVGPDEDAPADAEEAEQLSADERARHALAQFVTGFQEALADRPPVTREDVLNPRRAPTDPPPDALDDWRVLGPLFGDTALQVRVASLAVRVAAAPLGISTLPRVELPSPDAINAMLRAFLRGAQGAIPLPGGADAVEDNEENRRRANPDDAPDADLCATLDDEPSALPTLLATALATCWVLHARQRSRVIPKDRERSGSFGLHRSL